MRGGAFVATDHYNHYSLLSMINSALGLPNPDQQRPLRRPDERVLDRRRHRRSRNSGLKHRTVWETVSGQQTTRQKPRRHVRRRGDAVTKYEKPVKRLKAANLRPQVSSRTGILDELHQAGLPGRGGRRHGRRGGATAVAHAEPSGTDSTASPGVAGSQPQGRAAAGTPRPLQPIGSPARRSSRGAGRSRCSRQRRRGTATPSSGKANDGRSRGSGRNRSAADLTVPVSAAETPGRPHLSPIPRCPTW